MPFEVFELFPILRIMAATCVVLAVYFAFKLYRETDKGWYWGALVLSAFCFALSQWLFILLPRGMGSRELLPILQDLSQIAASMLFAVSCYGMYKEMHIIRKKVE